MSFNITVEGGTSVRLPTAGKYCDRDIIVTAEGGGVELDVVTASSLPAAVTNGQIVVITDTTPGTVYIDTDEPASPVTGDVWVKLEAEATVKLELTEESPYLRGGLTAAAQWDGSAWVSRDGYLGVDGAWEKISLSLPPIGTPLNDFTWEQISAISARGLADDYFSVGDAKEIVLNGTVGLTTFNNYSIWAFIIGIYHNPTREGGYYIHFQIGKSAQIDGKSLCFANEVTGSEAADGSFVMNLTNTTVGGWESCVMRTDILGNNAAPSAPESGSMMAALPSALRNVMKGAKKYSDNTGGAVDGASYMTETTDYLWLPSEWEVFGSKTYGNSAESTYQKQYEYYASGNSKVFYKHIDPATSISWWLRSARADHSGRFGVVTTASKASATNAGYACGINPCFCV